MAVVELALVTSWFRGMFDFEQLSGSRVRAHHDRHLHTLIDYAQA